MIDCISVIGLIVAFVFVFFMMVCTAVIAELIRENEDRKAKD